MNFFTTVSAATEAAADSAAAQSAANPMMGFMSWFFAAIGVYLIYSAITGKGQLYKNDYPASIKDEVFKMTRVLAWVEGPILIIGAIPDLNLIPDLDPDLAFIITMTTLVLGFLGVVAYIVILYKRFGKEIRKSKNTMPKF